MTFYYINLFQLRTFKGTCLVSSLNMSTLRVNILNCKFVRIYFLLIEKHSDNFIKIALLVQG